MKKSTQLGMNKTGIDFSPIDSQRMVEEAEATPPTSTGTFREILSERDRFIREAEPMGSVPVPGNIRGVVQAGIKKMTLKRPEVFIDKVAERLAFERTGVRLYEALLQKCEILGGSQIPIEQLRQFQQNEHSHFLMLREVMLEMGADPTALTPCADGVAVESMGLGQVLTDPRTSLAQCLHAILVAELTDREGWESLIQLAKAMKEPDLESRFQLALNQEENHLLVIRNLSRQLTEIDVKAA